MATGTVSVHSWNDSSFFPSSSDSDAEPTSPPQISPGRQRRGPYSPKSRLPGTIGNVGPVPGRWVDVVDDGEPEMGASYNARLEPRPNYLGSRRDTTIRRDRATGRGLRSNPVQAQRFGLDDGDEEAGW